MYGDDWLKLDSNKGGVATKFNIKKSSSDAKTDETKVEIMLNTEDEDYWFLG